MQGFQNEEISDTENGNDLGRRTISDDILAAGRDAWRSLFEEYWPNIGWSLLNIRKTRASTIEDVRSAFAALTGKPHSAVAAIFWSGSPLASSGPNLRSNRKRLSDIRHDIQVMDLKHREMQGLCTEAETALRGARTEDRETIQTESNRRSKEELDFVEDLARLENEYHDLDRTVLNEEAYWYSSELLDFLQDPRCALEPINLATALAGLPIMEWRQSRTRCLALPGDWVVRLPYLVVCAISLICKRWDGEFQPAPTEFYRTQLAKLSWNHREARECLSKNWRDLRLAIEECRTPDYPTSFIPYAISAVFMRRIYGDKTSSDRVLDSRERLSNHRDDNA
jgi:hypothetical protein